ncbi:MAG: ribosome small subunit-dependent GTPase A [Myxococcota bacterium]
MAVLHPGILDVPSEAPYIDGVVQPDEELSAWGYVPEWRSAFEALDKPSWLPARVTVGYRALYDLATQDGVVTAARVAGKFKHENEDAGPLAFPAVGDWVAVDLSHRGSPIIRALLPRRTAFIRKAAGRPDDAQVVAANVDAVFLVSSLNEDFNPRRIERYLAMAHESGAQPAIVLNKSDLVEDSAELLQEVREVGGDTPVHVVSAKGGTGVEALLGYFEEDATVALLGSSGVGKSTLTNRLLGAEVQKTREIRADGKGRHTTTNRSLFRVPTGGLILDTPGMRELHVWEGERGVEEAFADILELAAQCRFRDCRHKNEPGCAVRAAVADGRLAAGRLEAYHKLVQETSSMDDESRSRRGR